MGWPEGVDFIQYKAVFFDWDYDLYGCHHDDKWNLTKIYQKKCPNAKGDLDWFYGFKHTQNFNFSGQFYDSNKGYTFNV